MDLKRILSVFFTLIITFGLLIGGKTMAKEILTQKQKNIVSIASYTASGDLQNLEKALNRGLDEGLTINEIKEILVQMYAYCGFPRSLNGINTFIQVTETRKANGIADKLGEEGKVLTKDTDKNEYGTKVQTELVGAPVKGAFAEFAPAIDAYLKEHLFADIFARGVLTNQEREIATIAALSTIPGVEPQLNSHIQMGKNTGLTQDQIDEILDQTKQSSYHEIFARGEKNTAYAKYFIGQSYLNMLTTKGVPIGNVTFEPGCRNNWHIHHKGGQILLVTNGRGYYQEWGKPAQELHPGDVVYIPAEVKHWHGAAHDSWFTHLAIEIPAEGSSNEWLEEVSEAEYSKLK